MPRRAVASLWVTAMRSAPRSREATSISRATSPASVAGRAKWTSSRSRRRRSAAKASATNGSVLIWGGRALDVVGGPHGHAGGREQAGELGAAVLGAQGDDRDGQAPGGGVGERQA